MAIRFGRIFCWAVLILALSSASFAQLSVAVSFGPPALPVYVQPPCPAEGYIWTPGYWAYDPDFGDYYWVPGTWVLAPVPGYFGPQAGGDGAAAGSFSMWAIGARLWVSMAGSITASATSATAMKAAAGTTDASSTTAR